MRCERATVFFFLIAQGLSLLNTHFIFAQEQPAPAKSKTSAWNLEIAAPKVETTLAAFLLRGKRRIYQFQIPDLDILVTPENKRLVPLLRLLRSLEVGGNIENNRALAFKYENGPDVRIDIPQKHFQVDDKEIPLEMKLAASDVTGLTELYVSEDILKYAFDFDFKWDELYYEYNIKTQRELSLFTKDRLPSASAFSVKVKKINELLAETEPPAYPVKSKAPLTAVQADAFVETTRQWDRQSSRKLRTSGRPGLTFWGHLLNGDYKVNLRKDIDFPHPQMQKFSSWLENGIWTSKRSDFLVNIGDTSFGLSDLVAPAVNLFGASFKGLSRSKKSKSRLYKNFEERDANFLSSGTFEGYAILGSTVDLWINNRLVDSKTVDDVDDAALGYGYYRFEGIGLLDKTLNDVKVVIKQPNGAIEEFHKEVLGCAQLLPSGQLAYTAGAGTHKERSQGELTAKGQFFGTQFLYGLTDWLTLGLTAATQEKFADLRDEDNRSIIAPRGYYLAQEARWKLSERMFAKGDIGFSYDPEKQDAVPASKLDLEYFLKKLKLGALLFLFGPEYSNGVTSLSDRKGYNFSAEGKLFDRLASRIGFLHIRDNLNGNLDHTQREDLLTANITLPTIFKKIVALIQAGHSKRTDSNGKAISANMYTLDARASLTPRLGFDAYYTFGDKLSYFDELKSGVPVTNIGGFYSYGTKAKLNYKLDPSHSLAASYWKTTSNETAEIESTYNHPGRTKWSSRFSVGMNLLNSKLYGKEFLEFRLGSSRDNRFGIKAEYNQSPEEYSIGFYVKLKSLFFVDGTRLRRIAKDDISPEKGGIQGTVYLDLDFNGHRDKGEPPVPNILVLLDSKHAGESNKDGIFYISRRLRSDNADVSLDIDTLPAIYTPTQGIQKAYWQEGIFTKVNLGVGILNSVSGAVKVIEIIEDAQQVKNAPGIRIVLLGEDQETLVKDSVTDDEGAFYIGEIRPGVYFIKVDKDTLPFGYEPEEEYKKISIKSSKRPIDIEKVDFYVLPTLKENGADNERADNG